jgi:4-hydroxy-tetrahydrodipicolinate reductase
MLVRVAVIGYAGRMGSTVCAAVEADPELEVVARVGSSDGLDLVLDAGADVAVEFTVPTSVKANTTWLLKRGVHTVVGATGLSDADLEELAGLTGPANCFVAPNFAVGAVLMMRFAREAAGYMPRAEIVELHNEAKKDAPSGTAKATAEVVGGEPAIHSVRLPGLVAHQEVLFGGEGQLLTIRHDTFSREAFVPGVLLALERMRTLPPGLTVGLETFL